MLDAAKTRLAASEMKPCRSMAEENDILFSKLLRQGILSNICVIRTKVWVSDVGICLKCLTYQSKFLGQNWTVQGFNVHET